MEITSRPYFDYFFAGEDPIFSDDPKIRVILAQIGHAYESAILSGNRELAEGLKKEAYQLKVTRSLERN